MSSSDLSAAAVRFGIAVLAAAALCTAQARELQCTQSHPGGAREQIRVAVDGGGSVRGFWWWYAMRDNKDYCTIPADTFRADANGDFTGRQGCALMVWRQGARLTFSLSPATPGCLSYCSSTRAYERLLPIALKVDGTGCSE